MPVNLNATAINPTEAQYQPMLADLQGNILKGHGRDHTINLFIKFKAGRQALVKDWISAFTKTFVTSAKKQMEQTDYFKTHKISAGMFVNLFLTSNGYRYLGVEAAKTPANPAFRNGMKASGPALKDPAPSSWDAGYDADIHAMILIADDSPQLVRALKRAIILSLQNLAIPLREEPGKAIRNKMGNGIEHNGYADGVSQPLFFQKDLDDEAGSLAFEGGHSQWNPAAPLNLALVKDPGGRTADSYGSYFIYRKLEQNVKLFKDKEAELAVKLGLTGDAAERVGGLVVGRFEDGTPVTNFDEAQSPGKDLIPNNFDYLDDSKGLKCPFQGHIRKTNPRSDGAGEDFNKMKRIVRRGIPFEDKARVMDANGEFDEAHFPEKGVGLIFMCFVADIQAQFEFMQKSWVNDENFVNQGTGIDPIIGQHNGAFAAQHWNKIWNDTSAAPAHVDFKFADAVTMKGGAYFFAPSMSFLDKLKVSSDPLLPSQLQPFV
jgi:Dyp-type peroxidase family